MTVAAVRDGQTGFAAGGVPIGLPPEVPQGEEGWRSPDLTAQQWRWGGWYPDEKEPENGPVSYGDYPGGPGENGRADWFAKESSHSSSGISPPGGEGVANGS